MYNRIEIEESCGKNRNQHILSLFVGIRLFAYICLYLFIYEY